MPYTIQKRGNEYCLIRGDGSTKSCHATKEKAEASRRLIKGKEEGWRPTKSAK